MKTAIAMLVGLALISTALPAQAADQARSRELMSLMKADEIAVGAMKYGLRRKQAEAGLSNAQLDCVDTLSPTQFTDAVTTAIADGLTDEEVSAAMAFYRTPAGSRFVEFSVARMSGKSAPQLNEDDLAKVREFAATPAGTKLLKQNLPGTADVVTNKMAQLTGDTIENCGKAKPK
jgi:hypothetical protein